jgi:hypothetical protein
MNIHSTSLARLREEAYTVPSGITSVELTCGHPALYTSPAPGPGENAYCRTCRRFGRRKRVRKSRAINPPGGGESPGTIGGDST